ncbi:MAG TPA: hypothetical protein VF371_10075 [Candidatus Limnocylindrales bacterium]
MGPTDVELVRLGHSSRPIAIGLTAVALLLAVAVVKPWSVASSPALIESASPQPVAAAISAYARSPVPSLPDPSGSLCAGPDGWRIVADEVQVGRTVRTWLGATAQYSVVPPVRSTVPVASLISSGVTNLVFCLPTGGLGSGETTWSGTLWRQGGDAASWQETARLTPVPGSLVALADPFDGSAGTWSPGRYILEARFDGSVREAWLGLLIRAPLGRLSLARPSVGMPA